ncbi:hypothetical protein RI129_010393 [Pyrocoelia pectoralis]|uniref:Cytochrome b5-related protein n=1 Tax=Pyrocoelia pectoralis TaxID=417401 RepID=A0AAN7VAE1_9COLE
MHPSTMVKRKSTLGIKRMSKFYPEEWLEEKRMYDGAEGLWRIHDNLYDLNDFMSIHPGGKFWIEVTKGLDITEAFESHHISLVPEKMLPKYFVRKVSTPRNSPYTFKDNGFYRTLKRNVRKVLNDVPPESATKTDTIVDGLFVSAIFVGTLAAVYGTFTLAVIAGFLLGVCTVASHNYYHRKDNFRMYYNDVSLTCARDWRIVHVLSHHGYPNSVADIQVFGFEPFLQFYPHQKSTFYKVASRIFGPLVIWPTFVPMLYFRRFLHWKTTINNFTMADLIPLVLPLFFCIASSQSFIIKISVWIVMVTLSSFWFCLVGLLTTHNNPDIFIDGDTPRSEDEMDWGINQLDTVGDKTGVVNTHFLGLISFGDHGLHHLLPTLDHGVLQHLYPIFFDALKEFNLFLRVMGKMELWNGYLEQLKKEIPNPNPPNLSTYGITSIATV